MKRGDIVKIKNSGYGVIASYPTEERACVIRFEIFKKRFRYSPTQHPEPRSFKLKNLTLLEDDELAGIDLSEIDLHVIKPKKNLT
jgi:hypothetical protein